MKALRYEAFGGPIELVDIPDPVPPADGVVLRVDASGLCLSDWHGWMGHDPDIRPPHIPGHELAGTVVAVGPAVTKWKAGARVTAPFSLGCATCAQCVAGFPNICDRYYQPGFTGPGSFAQYVALPYADHNLVALPDAMTAVTAALLGCRFATAYRAVVTQGRLQAGEWVAVYGCGGVGLSAVMIAHALGGRVAAVDRGPEKLAFAKSMGADLLLDARALPDVPAALRDAIGDGAHISIDALGSTTTCVDSVRSLRKRGRHVQVGLMMGKHARPPIPMAPVIANELEIVGSHGVPARDYRGMLDLIGQGRLHPERLLARTVSLEQAATELPQLASFAGIGVTVIDRF